MPRRFHLNDEAFQSKRRSILFMVNPPIADNGFYRLNLMYQCICSFYNFTV